MPNDRHNGNKPYLWRIQMTIYYSQEENEIVDYENFYESFSYFLNDVPIYLIKMDDKKPYVYFNETGYRFYIGNFDNENFLNRPLHTLLDRVKVEVTSIKIATYKKNEFIEKNASYLPIACARIHLPSWEEYKSELQLQREEWEASKVNA